MTPPKTVSIIGYKNSGKTSVAEALINELTSRGAKVVSIKHTAEDVLLDTPGKDTERHRKAGAKSVAILHDKAGAIFYDHRLSIQEAAKNLGEADYLVIEGFKTVKNHAKLIIPREDDEVKALSSGLELAIINLHDLMLDTDVPIHTIDEIEKIADIVEKKAYIMLPELDCGGCGYENCLKMGKAILRGEKTAKECVVYKMDFTLKVNDEEVPVNNFVRRAMENVLLGFIKTLKGGESAKKIELEFRKYE
jgi:molybdopterin-guanine dinucleotide biosynthesis protein B